MVFRDLKKIEDKYVDNDGNIVIREIDNLLYEYKEGNYILYKEYSKEEIEKSKEIFYLMNIGKMTLTEINTLTDKERFFLSKWFMEKIENEKKMFKDQF